ncbi:MAG: PEP-CTERM sorting domain-containing protein [Phycisphaerales bacterium]|nr:PEP-CTERM sorting domain-containing protein [Phycisphaerales bacterium]
MKVQVLTLAVFTGISTASPVPNTNIESLNIQDPADSPTTLTIDISGVGSGDAQGSPINTMLIEQFPSQFLITGISWDLTIETIGASWLSEANIRLFNTDQTGGYTFAPGIGNDFPGISNYAGFVDLVDLVALNLDFTTNGDNLLNIEFFESFDDAPGAFDAFYLSGSTLTIHLKKVPAPGSLAVLGLGGLVASRRKR